MDGLTIKDFVLLLIIGIWLVGAMRFVYKSRKAGKCVGCSHDCSHCSKMK